MMSRRTFRPLFLLAFLLLIALSPAALLAQSGDTDGDGVGNSRDNCPTQSGPVNNQGCPLTFVIIPAQPADKDGDGVPDSRDDCPNQAGAPDNDGCPEQELTAPQPPPADTDGDGVPDSRDGCPNQAGAPENGGCPVSVLPADNDGDGVTNDVDQCPDQSGPAANNGCPVPDVVLPPLPASGQCVVATLSATAVNVRETHSTGAAIVGALDPTQTYPVVASFAGDDGQWFQLQTGGWVAAWVTRHGGDCDSLPQPGGDLTVPAADSAAPGFIGGVTVAVGDVDAGPSLPNCPDLVPTVQSLPNFLKLYVIGEPEPCAAAEAELDDLFLTAGQRPSLSEDISLDDLFDDCPETYGFIPSFLAFMDNLNYYAPDTWQAVNDLLVEYPVLACDIAFLIWNFHSIPQNLPDQHVMPFAVTYCAGSGLSKGWFNKTVGFLNLLGISRAEVEQLAPVNLGDTYSSCDLIHVLQSIGQVPSGNVEFFQLLHGACQQTAPYAAQRAFVDAIRGGFDAGAAVNEGCAGDALLESLHLPDDLLPALPRVAAQSADCDGAFRQLATFNSALGLNTVYKILKSVDPCASAETFVMSGGLDAGVPSAPACIQGSQLIIPADAIHQQIVLTAASAWHDKLGYLDRPLDQICDRIATGDGQFAPNPADEPLGLVLVPSPTPLGLVLNTSPDDDPVGVPPGDDDQPPQDQPDGNAPSGDDGQQDQSGGEQPSGNNGQQDQTGDQQPNGGEGQPEPPQGDAATAIAPVNPDAGQGGAGANEINLDDTDGVSFSLPRVGWEVGALGLFETTAPDGSFSGAYIVRDAQHVYKLALPDGAMGPVALSPDDEVLVYFMHGDQKPEQARQITVVQEMSPHELEEIQLVYHKIEWQDAPDGSSTPNLGSDSIWIDLGTPIDPSVAVPAFMQNFRKAGTSLLLTLRDAAGAPGLYQLDLSDLNHVPAPSLVVENGSGAAVAPNGRYVAFERADEAGRNLYVMAANSGEIRPITQQNDGSECFDAKFGPDSRTLYFSCQNGGEQGIFRYGIMGVAELATGIPNAAHPAPAPSAGFITFDDGATIYLSRDDGSEAVPILSLEGQQVNQMVWSQPERTSETVTMTAEFIQRISP